MANITTTEYSKTYDTFSGADIKATFGGRVVGELQSITYSVTREKAPVFTMGDPNPRSFSRGKRGIAGSLVFTVFDRDALAGVKERSTVHRHAFNSTTSKGQDLNIRRAHEDANVVIDPNYEMFKKGTRPHYSDEIPPFDISISFMNEYGKMAQMSIYGVEILNEGMGLSIDDLTTEKSCTFVARGISDMNAREYESN